VLYFDIQCNRSNPLYGNCSCVYNGIVCGYPLAKKAGGLLSLSSPPPKVRRRVKKAKMIRKEVKTLR
jgi:hypothetical protein